MIAFILSSSALILFLILLRKLLRGRINPTLQYALWLLVAARLLIPGPLFTAPVSIAGAAEYLQSAVEADFAAENSLPAAGNPISGVPDNAQLEEIPDHSDAAVTYYPPDAATDITVRQVNYFDVIWKLGILLTGGILLLSNLKFYVNLRKKRRQLPEEELPHPCKTRVYLVEDLPSPCLFGLFRPSIYVNRTALEPGRLEHILVHEETHYRHGDHLWSLLRCLCLAVHWYNPLVWWAASLSRRDCELSCDDGAIRRLGEEKRLDYGQTLLAMVTPGTSPSGLLRTATTMNGAKQTMTERIGLIAKRPRMLKITLVAVLLVMCGAVAVTFGGSAEAEAPDDINVQSSADSDAAGGSDLAAALDEERAAALYRQAREVWDWFELGTLPVANDTFSDSQGTFYRVDGFDTQEELRGYLLTLFSPELADHLLTDYQFFREIGGALFVQPAGRGSSIYAGEERVQAFVTDNAAQYGYNCHIYATTEVLDTYDLTTVLYQKRHDWFISWSGENYVFTSFGPWDDVDPQRYYNALTILDHYERCNTIVTWLPMLWDLDWNALYATRDQWPEGFDLGLYVIESLYQYITEQGAEITGVQYRDILSATEGLDGAYAEGFQAIVYRLYIMNPSQFADTALNDLSAQQQAQVIDYLRWELAYRENNGGEISREEVLERLENDLIVDTFYGKGTT